MPLRRRRVRCSRSKAAAGHLERKCRLPKECPTPRETGTGPKRGNGARSEFRQLTCPRFDGFRQLTCPRFDGHNCEPKSKRGQVELSPSKGDRSLLVN